VATGYGASTVIFTVSAFVPGPWRYLLRAFALIQEAGFLLLRNGERPRGRARNARPAAAGLRPCETCSSRRPIQPAG
jgi:hypothetical protein